jgi:FkbM family methyltransferase
MRVTGNAKRSLTKGWSITTEPLQTSKVKKMQGYACFRAEVKLGGCTPETQYTVGINVYGADVPVFGGIPRFSFNPGVETIDGVSKEKINSYILGAAKSNREGDAKFRRILPVRPGTYDVQLWIARGIVPASDDRPLVCYKSGDTFGDSKLMRFDLDTNEFRTAEYGHRMFMHPVERSGFSNYLLVHGDWEPVTTEFARREIKPGDVVLDIGAHIGYFTLIFARLVGERGRVFAFEPDPTNYALLEKNVKANGYTNVTLVQKAVSDKSERIKLFSDRAQDGRQSIIEFGDDCKGIEVESVRLDDFFRDYSGPIDFVKMDIEGAEPTAIEGMTRLLGRNEHVKLMTEFLPSGLRRSGVNPSDYLELLGEHGFEPVGYLDDLNGRSESLDPARLIEGLDPETDQFVAGTYPSPSVNLFYVKGGRRAEALPAT